MIKQKSVKKSSSVSDCIIAIMLVIFTVAILAVSLNNLVVNGMFSQRFQEVSFNKMILEIIVDFLLLTLGFYHLKKAKYRILFAAASTAIFSYIHVCFIPMLISFLYIAAILLAGFIVRKRLIRILEKVPAGLDFILGSGLYIVLFCLMSAAGVGSIENMRYVTIFIFVIMIAYCCMKKELPILPFKKEQLDEREQWKLWQALLVAAIMLFFFIQIGRMNITQDYDSLWYGLRPEYNLNTGNGIYEDLSLVGVVYTYPKGFETLMMPISGLSSYGFIYSFNIMVTILVSVTAYQIMRRFTGSWKSLFGVLMVVSIPSLMNMAITAKTDNITVLYQLLIILASLQYLKEQKPVYLLYGIAAYLLALTCKPTSLMFATAIIGMSGLYLLISKQFSLKTKITEWLVLLPPFGAFIGICARTYLLVGLPITSSFSQIALKLGFQVNYPYRVDQIVQYSSKPSPLSLEGIKYYLTRLYGIFVLPDTSNMDHIIIAWGTCLIPVLLVLIFIGVIFWRTKKKKAENSKKRNLKREYTTTLMWWIYTPFLIINIIAMLILDKPDGNYFSAFYILTVIMFLILFVKLNYHRQIICTCMVLPILASNVLFSALTNWAWSVGFTPIDLINEGYIDNQAYNQTIALPGNDQIFQFLKENEDVKLMCFGSHPDVLRFPCVSESFLDVSYWGNSQLSQNIEAFKDYLDYAEYTHVYIQNNSNSIYSNEEREMFSLLIEDNYLEIIIEDNGNKMARIIDK